MSTTSTQSSLIPGKTTQQTVVHKTFTSLGDLIKFLPTGTFFLFVVLNPVLTNDGKCNTVNRYLSGILMVVCGFSCCLSWFTDSYVDISEGSTYYGIVTKKGLFVLSDSDTKSVNSSRYKLRLGDFLHALLSVLVFAIVALLDPNTVQCFYPSFGSEQKLLLMALPPVVGTIFSFVFVMFPNKRHGIGYPSSHVSQES